MYSRQDKMYSRQDKDVQPTRQRCRAKTTRFAADVTSFRATMTGAAQACAVACLGIHSMCMLVTSPVCHLERKAVEQKSLNEGKRRRDLQQITSENYGIVRRIQAR
eukprot:3416588-Pleurochrysis_carterae.AAC.3